MSKEMPRSAKIAVLIGLFVAVQMTAMCPSSSAVNWSRIRLPGIAGKAFLLGASCTSQSSCLAVGTNNLIASSTDPRGGAWNVVYGGEGPWPESDEWKTNEISGRQIQGISCPSPNLCVAVTDLGDIYTSTDPTGSESSWQVADIDGQGRNIHLFAVSCPTATFCAAVSGKRTDPGYILTSTNPAAGALSWHATELGDSYEFRGISCGTPSFCVAVDDSGRLLTSVDPEGGLEAWRLIGTPAGPGSLRAVSCVATTVCVSGNEGGNILASTDPTGSPSSWHTLNGGASVQITGISCPSASRCLAVDNNGDVLTSTDPGGGSGSWASSNLLPFTEAEGNALFGVSCPSTRLCVLVGARGQIFTGVSPFDPNSTPIKRGSKQRLRPRVKIASIHLPFRRQLENGNGRVLIRFYARGGARGFECRFDRRRYSRCRSPKRYPVTVGRHRFFARAIGYTGLRGPVTREVIKIPPLCTPAGRPAGARPAICG
jgi:hypothetical protein